MPEGVTAPTQYGKVIAALAAYFQTLHCLPEKRLSQMFADVFGIGISAATLARLIAKKAREMIPFVEEVSDLLSGEQTAVKHLDETGFRVAGKTRWIHVLCSTALSFFRLGASRGDVPGFLLGKAIHDCFSSYSTLEGVENMECAMRIPLRELEARVELITNDFRKAHARCVCAVSSRFTMTDDLAHQTSHVCWYPALQPSRACSLDQR